MEDLKVKQITRSFNRGRQASISLDKSLKKFFILVPSPRTIFQEILSLIIGLVVLRETRVNLISFWGKKKAKLTFSCCFKEFARININKAEQSGLETQAHNPSLLLLWHIFFYATGESRKSATYFHIRF